MILSGRLMFGFDGSFEYLIEENIGFNNGFELKATYRWNDDLGANLGTFYITLGNRF